MPTNNDPITPDNIYIHLGYIREDVAEIKKRLERNYITKQEFEPIKRLVYGVVALIGAGIVGLFLRTVIS
jgi:hypothetical protein